MVVNMIHTSSTLNGTLPTCDHRSSISLDASRAILKCGSRRELDDNDTNHNANSLDKL